MAVLNKWYLCPISEVMGGSNAVMCHVIKIQALGSLLTLTTTKALQLPTCLSSPHLYPFGCPMQPHSLGSSIRSEREAWGLCQSQSAATGLWASTSASILLWSCLKLCSAASLLAGFKTPSNALWERASGLWEEILALPEAASHRPKWVLISSWRKTVKVSWVRQGLRSTGW